MKKNVDCEDDGNIFQRYTKKHKGSLQLIFMYIKLFRVFNYFCNFSNKGIDEVLVQVNLKENQVNPRTDSVVNFVCPKM